jgi:DNA-binding transcriptional LysR family regulator
MAAKIDLRHMRAFLAVVEERTMSRAALRCHISQSALSKQIKAIETELGTRVFDRNTRNVSLTKAGRVFRREAIRAVEHGHRAVSLVQALVRAEQGPVHIGISGLCDRPRIHRLLESAEKSTKEVSTEVHAETAPRLVQMVLRGYLDMAIVELPVRGANLHAVPLYSEPLVVVLPEKYAPQKRETMNLKELANVPITLLSGHVDPARPVIERLLRKSGAGGFKVRDAESVFELLDLILLEDRAALVRASTRRIGYAGVAYKQLVDSPAFDCALVWRADNRNPALLSLIYSIRAFNQATATP